MLYGTDPIALEVRTVGAGGFGSLTSVDCTPGESNASEIEDGTGSFLQTDMSFNNIGFVHWPLSWMATMPDVSSATALGMSTKSF